MMGRIIFTRVMRIKNNIRIIISKIYMMKLYLKEGFLKKIENKYFINNHLVDQFVDELIIQNKAVHKFCQEQQVGL